MSAYGVGKLFFEIGRNPQLIQQFQQDPDSVMERYDLTEEEKAALRNKDMRYLYKIGVNPYQLIGAVRLLGVPMGKFFEDIADAGPHPELATVSFPGPAPGIEEVMRRRR